MNLLSDTRLAKAIRCAAIVATGIAALSCSGDHSTGPITIDPPTSVTAVLVSPTSARVTWTASTQADKVSSYNIFRNGTKIGVVPGTSFTDDSLVELTQYSYTVSANGPSGITSPLSASSPSATITPPDVTPPRVIALTPSAGATGVPTASVIDVTFSENVDQSTLDTVNFAVKTSGGTRIQGAVTYTPSTHVAEFRPSASFPSGGGVSISISGVKDLAGNGMSVAFVSAFAVRDETPPTVVASTPPSGATSVPVTTPIIITFSEQMNASTINASTLTLTGQGQGAVSGAVAYDSANMRATLTPAASLQNSTTYTIAVASGMTDMAGNALVGFSASFSTTAPADITPPAVTGVSPSNSATDVAINIAPTLTFNRALNPGTINSSTITLTPSGGAAVAASVSYNAATSVVTVTPSAELSPSTTYTVTATTGVQGSNNVSLGAAFTSTFTTVGPSDTTPPTVTSSSPADGATNVAVNAPLSVTFSEAMDSAAVTASIRLWITVSGANVPGTVTYNPATKTATFLPQNPLAYSTRYSLLVLDGAKDLAGNRLEPDATILITTMPQPDVTPPGVSSVFPADGETNVAVNPTVSVVFNRSMNASTINSSTITLAPNGGSTVPATVTFNAGTNTATLIPSAALNASTTYRLTITTGVQGSNNVALPAQLSTTFTTIAAGPPPQLSMIVLDFCSKSVPLFFAYKNEGQAWARVFPDGNGSFTFMATPKVAITSVGDGQADTYYTSSQELQAVNGVTCVTQGEKTLNLSVANLEDGSVATVTAGSIRASGTSVFTITSVPNDRLDLVAMSYRNGSSTPNEAIIRRNLMLQSGSSVPVFDFAAPEAFTLGTNQLNVSGLLSGEFNNLLVDFTTSSGTDQGWEDGFAYSGPTHAFETVPAANLADGDLHTLSFTARGDGFTSRRSEIRYFHLPSDQNIVLGSKLNKATFSTVASAPYLRIRGMLVSQPEYGKAVRFSYTQLSSSDTGGERDWNVTGTVGYFGGSTPSTWDLEMPDLSAVSGFPASMGFEASQRTTTFAEAWSDLLSLFVGRAPRDGDSVKNAGATSDAIPGK